MKLLNTLTLLSAFGWAGLADAQLQLLPDKEPQQVFGGDARQIAVVWRNDGGQNFENEIRARILQASSATTVLISENPVNWIQVPAGETVLESVALDFPAVKAETKFIVQWLADTNVIGKTEMLVYPTNLLAELKPLADGRPVGVFDPLNQLKPLLKSLKVEFVDFENSGLENFSGRLAVIGPFQSQSQVRDGLASEIKSLAMKGATIVWLQPPSEPRDKLKPSFYTVPAGTNSVVIVQADFVADLAKQPQAQLRLLQLARLALNPEPPTLPQFPDQPL